METELQNYKDEIKKVKRELAALPAGYLNKKAGVYYHETKNKSKGITKDRQLIRRLARKAYLQKWLKCLESRRQAGELFVKRGDQSTPAEIIQSLSKTYQQLPVAYFFEPKEDDWQNQPYEKNPYPFKDPPIITNSGIRVRSKSELILANMLDECKIPYRYEAALHLGKKVKYPDFTIKRPSDGKIIYLEHFGALDDTEYVIDMNEKLSLYASYNILPMRDLLCTFEEDVVDSKRLLNIIAIYL